MDNNEEILICVFFILLVTLGSYLLSVVDGWGIGNVSN